MFLVSVSCPHKAVGMAPANSVMLESPSPMKLDLANLAHIVLDMDGTLYLGKTLFPESLPFLDSLTRNGLGYSYVTNNCSKSRAEYAAHLQQMGIPSDESAICTSAHATIFYLQSNLPKL